MFSDDYYLATFSIRFNSYKRVSRKKYLDAQTEKNAGGCVDSNKELD